MAVAGGGTLLRQVIGAGLLEQVELHLAPVVPDRRGDLRVLPRFLGDGTRLYDCADAVAPAAVSSFAERWEPSPTGVAVRKVFGHRGTHEPGEARRLSDGPPTPCFAGVASGRITDPTTTVLSCPDATEQPEEAQARIRHGGAAHSGHLLAYWDLDGVRYAVSVHGTSPVTRQVIEKIVASINLVDE